VSGVQWYSRPMIVSFEQMWTYAAPASSRHSRCGGIAVKPLPSALAATLTVQKRAASAIERFDQSPVLT